MKLVSAAASALLFSAFAASALPAGSTSVSAYATNNQAGFAQKWRKTQAVKALRAEGLKVQAADGGTLTPAHRAELQEKLDRIAVGNY